MTISKSFMVIIGTIFIIFVYPLFIFGCGYLSGWLAKLIIGNWLISGFDTIHLPIVKDNLPIVGGTLAWIGSFFKNSNFKYET